MNRGQRDSFELPDPLGFSAAQRELEAVQTEAQEILDNSNDTLTDVEELYAELNGAADALSDAYMKRVREADEDMYDALGPQFDSYVDETEDYGDWLKLNPYVDNGDIGIKREKAVDGPFRDPWEVTLQFEQEAIDILAGMADRETAAETLAGLRYR